MIYAYAGTEELAKRRLLAVVVYIFRYLYGELLCHFLKEL